MNKTFYQIWDQLRGKKAQYKEFLEEVTIENIRGITNLSVRFEFPVTVIAGANASGKSTALFACACAYKVPGTGIKDYVPTTLFPNLTTPDNSNLSDTEKKTVLDFYYTHNGKRMSLRWKKGKSWNRSFMGQGGEQPQRDLYFRTLANLTSPSEIRSVLQIGKGKLKPTILTSDLIAFAMRILPLKYREVTVLNKGDKNLLFAKRENEDGGEQYSEFHMSAGERAILRISKDISQLKDALVLIDEIEAGMHPYTQQQLMLELQRTALRNNLQIIVTSHSPVILDSVPIEARIFLERSGNNVKVMPAYKDIIQKALYGQSLEKINILCEDNIGESFVLGITDVLNPLLNLIPDDIVVGRDTGKSSFPEHIRAMGKFNQLSNFVFVLGGDAKDMEPNLKKAGNEFGVSIQPLFIPGNVPEDWAWQIFITYPKDYALVLGITQQLLETNLIQINQQYDNATDKPTSIIKNKFISFCDILKRNPTDLMRTISRREADRGIGDVQIFRNELENQIRVWQSRK